MTTKTRKEDTPEFYTRFRESVTYHPTTGEFITAEATTRRAPGTVIGTLREDGAYIVSYDGKLYTASKLAYFWMTGHWPRGPITLREKKRAILDYRWVNLDTTLALRR